MSINILWAKINYEFCSDNSLLVIRKRLLCLESSTVPSSLPGVSSSLEPSIRQPSDDVRGRPARSLVSDVVSQRFHVGDSPVVEPSESLAKVGELEEGGPAELIVPSRATTG